MEQYSNLSQILKAYRDYTGLTQEKMAEKFGVSYARQWRRLENREHKRGTPKQDLEEISRTTGIPFDALIRLDRDVPVAYDLRKRIYATSHIDEKLLNLECLTNSIFKTSQLDIDANIEIVSFDKLFKEDQRLAIETCLEHDQDIYSKKPDISISFVAAASKLAPEVNLFVRSHATHIGHCFCFPLRKRAYRKLYERTISDKDLTKADLVPSRDQLHNACLHLFSLYADHSTTSLQIFGQLYILLTSQEWNEESHFSTLAVTKEHVEMCRLINMRLIHEDEEEQELFKTEIPPAFYAIQINELLTILSNMGRFFLNPGSEYLMAERP